MDWDGDAGDHWVKHHDRHTRMLEPYTSRLLETARITASDRVLDVGCGCGETTVRAARAAAQVTGVDVSTSMLHEARLRAEREGARNVGFVQADAQTTALGTFDVVISQFGVMFFADPQTAFANLAAALRPGGRLAFVCWQELFSNEHLLVPFAALAEHAPLPELGPEHTAAFSLADRSVIEALLERAGFADIAVEAVSARLRLGDTVPDVLDYLAHHPMAREMLDPLPPATVETAWRGVADILAPYAGVEEEGGVRLGSSCWMVSAIRA